MNPPASVLPAPTPRRPGLDADAVPPRPETRHDEIHLLDDPREWAAFSRRVADRQSPSVAAAQAGATADAPWESSVVFEGMYCAACAGLIEQALCAVPGVQVAEVNAASHRGRVVWDATRTKPSEWMAAVQRAGYRPLPAHDAVSVEQRRAETRKMLWRLGVAALCMMQVMMYATPTYLVQPGDMTRDVEHLLRWASWVLSIPVLLFSCRPFFQNAWRDLTQRRISMDLPVSLGMLITFVVSTLGTFEPDGMFGREVFFDSFTMFVFFLLCGRWLELRLRDRTAGALEALMNRIPESVLRQEADGSWARVPVRRLQVGERVRVLPGEVFPADGVLLAGHTLADEALLTGESKPRARGEGQAVIAGSLNLSAPVELRIDRVGAETRFAQIVGLMESASTAKPELVQLVDRLAKPFLIAVLGMAALAALWWWPRDPGHALMIAVSILIVTCPCALSLATPAALLASAGALARHGVLVRRLGVLESLAVMGRVVFDKTGTLSRDAFALEQVRTRPGVTREQALALAAALGASSLHPVSRVLVAEAAQQGAGLPEPMLEGAQEHAGQGVSARLAQPWQSLRGEVRLGSAVFCGVPQADGSALASHLSDGEGWIATFVLREDLRADALAAVSALRALGLEVSLLSGDQPRAVERVAEAVGIADARGACTPDDKLKALQAWQSGGERVAMVGDGLNDGPALAGAAASLAFGQSVPLAQAQADLVVQGERLMPVADTVRQARRTLRIVRQNLLWAALYNAVAVPLALMGYMPAWAAGLGMAASSLLVVLNAMRLSSMRAVVAEA